MFQEMWLSLHCINQMDISNMEQKIYVIVEEEVIDYCNSVNVWAFRDRQDAINCFNERIDNARTGWDTDAMGYTEEINKDTASIYVEGEWVENHSEITLFEKTLQ